MHHALDQVEVSLDEMLIARDERATRQIAALAQFGAPLVSLTIVMPGPVKDGWLPRRVMEVALEEMDSLIGANNWPLLSREVFWRITGPEAIYVVDCRSTSLKVGRHPFRGAPPDRQALGSGRNYNHGNRPVEDSTVEAGPALPGVRPAGTRMRSLAPALAAGVDGTNPKDGKKL